MPDLFDQGESDGKAEAGQTSQAAEEALLICDDCARRGGLFDFSRDCCLIRWVAGHVNKKLAAEWVAHKYGAERAARLRAAWPDVVKQIGTA